MKLFHELISDHAAAFPGKTAVMDQNGALSYRELDRLGNAFSYKLHCLGVMPGDAVAVYVPYAKEILTGGISVLRVGGIFIPLDYAYPEKRLEYILEDSGATAILTTHALWQEKPLGFPMEKVVFLDEPTDSDITFDGDGSLSEDSPALLLYTSGTTGKPKGVLHSQNMLLHIADCAKRYPDAALNADTRSGVMSSFPFVATMTFLIGPLVQGGTVCIAPPAARKDLGFLYQFIRESQVTHIFLPSGLAAIMAEDYDLSGVFVFAAGEKLRNFRALSPANVLINMYGSTETCAVVTNRIYGNEERIFVGQPFDNTRTMVVDESLRPVCNGENGELLISNSYMSKQYFRLPEQSAGKWVELDGTLWFRSGDRAVCHENGDIDILGRTDNMIKLRGFRIETGEVEAQIAAALPRLGRNDVGQLVVVVKSISGTDHLSCYYEASKELDKRAVKEEIAGYLAEYMVPDVWVRMDALPRNLNGKVMRNELPQPKRERKTAGVLDSEVIVRLLLTAADVLDTDFTISPEDRFTDIGGTSLNAMVYASALREQGIKISGAQVLQYNQFRKIAQAAEVVYEQLWSQEEYEAVRSDFAERGEHIRKVLPITPQQDEMLFEQILFPDTEGLRTVLFFQVDSVIAGQHLRNALDILAQENEELRSAIVFHGVSVIQQVITDRSIPLEIIEADQFESDALEAMRKHIAYTPIDLQYDSMIRFVCLHANGRSFLYVMVHSIAIRQEQIKSYLARLMDLLQADYPDDTSISGWYEILQMSLDSDEPAESAESAVRDRKTPVAKDVTEELCVYSENDGPKMVFVHTGNTGSEAYYRLADRIGDQVSFAVIEPFNLYHPQQAVYGIRNIAANYIRILKNYQPEGPYILGGWCYGGVVAHEMACQLEQAGEDVRYLFMLDSHALGNEKLREMSKGMLSEINAEYFETCPLFAELRENGMLEAMITNAAHVSEDLMNHMPSFYHGRVTYFKPELIPAGVTGDNFNYWNNMMKFEAGNFENYCSRDLMTIIHTPHEHDLMMDDPSLNIIVPEILKAVNQYR